MLATPLVGLTLAMLKGSLSGSLSLARTGMVTGTFFGVVVESLTAVGGRLVTLIVINAKFVPPLPSVIA